VKVTEVLRALEHLPDEELNMIMRAAHDEHLKRANLKRFEALKPGDLVTRIKRYPSKVTRDSPLFGRDMSLGVVLHKSSIDDMLLNIRWDGQYYAWENVESIRPSTETERRQASWKGIV
jgi:hypothetical protein